MGNVADAVRSQLRGMREALASLVLPAPCRICSQILDTGSRIRSFCNDCVDVLKEPLARASMWPVAAGQSFRPLPPVGISRSPKCHFCRARPYQFALARSFGAYSPHMSRAILLLKYGKVTPLGVWFAQRLASIVEHNPEQFAADFVIPVPLDQGRLRERGFNQAELIARPLARLLGIPFRSYLLVRTRPRPSHLRLTRRERWETVRGAYATQQSAKVDKLRLLLVDDVFTTGATLDACSQALKGAGAARVVGLTVARALPLFPALEAGLASQDFGE